MLGTVRVNTRILLPWPSSLHYCLSASLSSHKYGSLWLFYLLSSNGGGMQAFIAISPHLYVLSQKALYGFHLQK